MESTVIVALISFFGTLLGTAGGIIILALSSFMGMSNKLYSHYIGYVALVCAVMLGGLITFIITVKEKKWAEEMQQESIRLGLEEKAAPGWGHKSPESE